MAYTTRTRLIEYLTYRDVLKSINEAVFYIHKMVGSERPHVFLSHSHNDTELIQIAETMLIMQGAWVYIDHKDLSLPSTPNTETARQLRVKIKNCNKFVMVASDKALASKWVPWELGFADGEKPAEDIAILPVQETPGSWTGSEYVGLYSTIEEFLPGDWRVVKSGYTILGSQNLKDWFGS